MKNKDYKSVVIILLIVVILGCTEKNSFVDVTPNQKVFDTTYLAAVEQPQQRRILIEEFTGVSCPPCPSGHELVRNLKKQYPERIVVIANHVFNFPQAIPIKGLSRYDFRTQDATDIGKLFGGVSYMPAAVFNRKKIGSDYLINTTAWASAVLAQTELSTPVNVYASSTFNNNSHVATVKIRLAYTEVVSKKHALTVAITESKIIDAQKNQSAIDTFYTHNYVLRDVITQLNGSPILDIQGSKEQGRVIERTFQVSIDSAWEVTNCRIIAFVHMIEGDRMEVFQSVDVEVE